MRRLVMLRTTMHAPAARLSRPHAALPRVRLASTLLPRPRQRSCRSLCPAFARLGRAPLWVAPPRHAAGCRVLGSPPDRLDPYGARSGSRCPLESQASEEPVLSATHLDHPRVGETYLHRAL